MLINYECLWDCAIRKGNDIIWQVSQKKNMLVDAGEKAIIDTFFRNNASLYFLNTNFYVGFYSGSISETTELSTIPGEPPVLYGYSRQVIERSSVGWPTIEKHEGDWRVVSKTLTYTAVGGDIGPISGAFLCTGSGSVGALIGVLSWGADKTVEAGASFDATLRVKLK